MSDSKARGALRRDCTRPEKTQCRVNKQKEEMSSASATKITTGKIFIGRYGWRGAKKILPTDQSIVVINCKKMGDDRKVPNYKSISLYEMMQGLLALYTDKFFAIAEDVCNHIKKGETVCCACMMGKNRSQSVAKFVQRALSHQGIHVEIEYLGDIKPKP